MSVAKTTLSPIQDAPITPDTGARRVRYDRDPSMLLLYLPRTDRFCECDRANPRKPNRSGE